MRLHALRAGILLVILANVAARAQLVAPPSVDWVSIPSTASVGQSVSVGVGAHANLSDNSDGNDWNGSMAVVARIMVDLYRPETGSWQRIHEWIDPWRTPAEIWTSFTVNAPGTHYINVQVMDGRPWYSGVYSYSIGVPSPAPSITSQLSRNVNQGQSVSYQITATNSPTSYGASNLPSGLSVNTSTGLISGSIPTNGGTQGSNSTVNSTITATNSSGSDSKTLTWNITAANISTNASVSSSSIVLGQSLTLTRDGWTNFGIAWTENVIWPPSGGAQVLGNMQLGSQGYTPNAGAGSYFYQFRLVDAYYNYKDQWIEFIVRFPAPTSGQATNVQSNSVTLSWAAVGGATSYKIYRDGQLLGTTSSTNYTDTTALPNTSFNYTIRASNGTSTMDSPDSNAITVTTLAIDPNADSDLDGVPDYIEDKLGTKRNEARQNDTSNSVDLKIHRPN